MNTMTRRGFLASSAAGALLLGARGSAAAETPFVMGSQSYSFRAFPIEGAIDNLLELGLKHMEFFSAHVPLDPADPKFQAAKHLIAAKGIVVAAYGVQPFSADEAANRKQFEFAKAIGTDILTADPTEDAFDNLDKLTEEYGVKIAIHNHGPGARYDGVADTLKAVEGHSKMIGACLDTGHCIRSGEKPHEVIEQLGDRLISLHLKDWTHGGEEQIVGEGDLDLEKVAAALLKLNFTGPIMLEYELHENAPVPHMQKGLDNWYAAVAKAQGKAKA